MTSICRGDDETLEDFMRRVWHCDNSRDYRTQRIAGAFAPRIMAHLNEADEALAVQMSIRAGADRLACRDEPEFEIVMRRTGARILGSTIAAFIVAVSTGTWLEEV